MTDLDGRLARGVVQDDQPFLSAACCPPVPGVNLRLAAGKGMVEAVTVPASTDTELPGRSIQSLTAAGRARRQPMSHRRSGEKRRA